jgi:hypothetical protein
LIVITSVHPVQNPADGAVPLLRRHLSAVIPPHRRVTELINSIGMRRSTFIQGIADIII